MREFLRIQLFVFCCFLGGLAGAALSVGTIGRWALERYRADHPGDDACGMFPVPYLFLGVVAGGVIGAVLGWRLQRRLAGPSGEPSSRGSGSEPSAAADGSRDRQ